MGVVVVVLHVVLVLVLVLIRIRVLVLVLVLVLVEWSIILKEKFLSKRLTLAIFSLFLEKR